MRTARALICEELGDGRMIGQLRVGESALPVARDDEAVVRVTAANVAFVDRLMVAGGYQVRPDTPFVPGTSFVGEVVAPARHGGPSTGCRVAGLVVSGGAFATHLVVATAALLEVPSSVGHDDVTIAGALEAYVTANFALSRRTYVHAGEHVVVFGASGAIGHAAVDLALGRGARVAGVTSQPEQLTSRFGAEVSGVHVDEPLREWLLEWASDGVDVVMDPVGGPAVETALRRLGHGGRLLIVGFAGGQIPRLPANHVLLRNRSMLGVDIGAFMRERVGTAASLLEPALAHLAGTARPRVVDAIALEDLPEVLRSSAGLTDIVVAPFGGDRMRCNER